MEGIQTQTSDAKAWEHWWCTLGYRFFCSVGYVMVRAEEQHTWNELKHQPEHFVFYCGDEKEKKEGLKQVYYKILKSYGSKWQVQNMTAI